MLCPPRPVAVPQAASGCAQLWDRTAVLPGAFSLALLPHSPQLCFRARATDMSLQFTHNIPDPVVKCLENTTSPDSSRPVATESYQSPEKGFPPNSPPAQHPWNPGASTKVVPLLFPPVRDLQVSLLLRWASTPARKKTLLWPMRYRLLLSSRASIQRRRASC